MSDCSFVSHTSRLDSAGRNASGRVGIEIPRLARILELAAFLRVLAAGVVEWFVQRKGEPRVCVFPDTEYYWELARSIRLGEPYEILEWGDIPHFALRTPGYPAFLAGCQAVLGEHPMGVRLVQALLGTLTVWLVYRLVDEVAGPDRGPCGPAGAAGEAGSHDGIARMAAGLACVHPYLILMSSLILSEALFVPLALAVLWGMGALWNRFGRNSAPQQRGGKLATAGIALGVGVAAGGAILVRPSWSLFVPFLVGSWLVSVSGKRERLVGAVRMAGVLTLGLVVVMGPWWIRNARIYGRFVPTAIWLGASLYDGWNPKATGASDMTFLAEPEIWPLDELTQDTELTRRALSFVRDHPRRVLELAVVKLGRFWSPWPNAPGFRSLWLVVPAALVMGPLMFLMGCGLWLRRRDLRVWMLFAGPLCYFCLLHMAFASSMRYRVPAEAPALGLAAIGARRWMARAADQASG
jgi:uncharacterized membrane protein